MWTIAGEGIHPTDRKSETSSIPISEIKPPAKVVIPLSQHIGAPCDPLVKIGDLVKKYQKVGEAKGVVSSPVHSSITGKVIAIGRFPHPSGNQSNSIVIECEPFLTSDDRLMVEKSREVIEGMKIFMHIMGVREGYVGIENDKPGAIEAIKKSASGTNIKVISLAKKYPQGAEKQLIKSVTGKEVPSGGLPMDVGI